MKALKGKVAFVTGGSSGIGLGIVRVLAAEGMKVAFTYRRQDHLDEALSHLRGKADATVHPIKLDVTDRPGFARAAEEIERVLGPVQVLVNNAGIGVHGPVENATYDDWDWIVGVNIGGVVNGIVTFLPRMIASGLEGHIVNIASMGGVAALGSAGLYVTTKFAVMGLSEALRTDMVGRKIGVSVYCPGLVKSNISESEKGRPEHLANTGYKPPQPQDGEVPPDLMTHAMDPLEAGRFVLDGIKQNKLFILSHPEFRDVIAARNAALIAAIPDTPVDPARAESESFLLSNPIYSESA